MDSDSEIDRWTVTVR